MSKGNNLQSLFCGILLCISVTALIIACLAFTKKGGGKGEYYKGASGDPVSLKCLQEAAQYAGGIVQGGGVDAADGWFAFKTALSGEPGASSGTEACTPAMTS